MAKLSCNIDKNDRINRTVMGAILVLAALIGLGRGFMFLAGAVMVVEGIIGWCAIPQLTEKVQVFFNKKK